MAIMPLKELVLFAERFKAFTAEGTSKVSEEEYQNRAVV
jgi:hypothetical protein